MFYGRKVLIFDRNCKSRLSIVHNGVTGDPGIWGIEFYEDGTTLTSTHFFSPSPSSEPDVTDTFGPFDLSHENWRIWIKLFDKSTASTINIDRFSLSEVE